MGAELAGEFETHLTVCLDTAAGAMDASARLEHWAGRIGLKLTRIVLDRGSMPDQPMLTETGRGTLTERRAAAVLRSAELRAAGFPVIRVKIEAAPWNAGIPQTADEAAARTTSASPPAASGPRSLPKGCAGSTPTPWNPVPPRRPRSPPR